jgi:hypothetical protein
MTGGTWFILAILMLEFGAAISYAWAGKLPDALIWAGVGVSNSAWVWRDLK